MRGTALVLVATAAVVSAVLLPDLRIPGAFVVGCGVG
jgi:hypothetical protein